MKIHINEDGYITSYSIFGGTLEGAIEVDDSLLEQIDANKMPFYRYIDGQAVLDEEKYLAHKEEQNREEERWELVARRQSECFAIVNRGRVWYDQWSEEQYRQIKDWYEAWLAVTETGEIPKKPSFLD